MPYKHSIQNLPIFTVFKEYFSLRIYVVKDMNLRDHHGQQVEHGEPICIIYLLFEFYKKNQVSAPHLLCSLVF